MNTCIGHIKLLRYKLRMFEFPFNESKKVLCNNESIARTSSNLNLV